MEALFAALGRLSSACDETFPEPDPLRPEKNLAVALLERAIKDAARVFDIPPGRPDWCVQSAVEWLGSDDTAYPFSFLNVCDLLSFDSPLMRHAISDHVEALIKGQRHFSHRKSFSFTEPRKKTLKVA